MSNYVGCSQQTVSPVSLPIVLVGTTARVRTTRLPTSQLIQTAGCSSGLDQGGPAADREVARQPTLNILKDADADYAYRALVIKDDWKRYLISQVDQIDYASHFKEVVRERAPDVPERHQAMLNVWTAMAKLQDTPPYGGSGFYFRTVRKDRGAKSGLCAIRLTIETATPFDAPEQPEA